MAPITGTDRRYGYIRGLIRLATTHSRVNHREREWERICSWIAKLALEEGAVTSRHAVGQLKGFGEKAMEALKTIDEGRPSYGKPAGVMVGGAFRRKYCSAAAAMLVSLLDYVEGVEAECTAPAPGALYCSLSMLLSKADDKCEQTFLPHSVHQQAALDGVGVKCAAFQQMHELENAGLVKPRTRMHQRVFELLPRGRERAGELRAHGEGRDLAPIKHHRRVSEGERGVVLLLVDLREGGGQAHPGFWDLCANLEREDVRFETRALPVGAGDYMFVVADGPQPMGDGVALSRAARERVVPRIIERKSSDDVAASMKDGRWDVQQTRMEARARRMAADGGTYPSIEYLLEGPLPPAFVCPCARCARSVGDERGVGGCPKLGYPSVGEVRERVGDVDGRYRVQRTDDLVGTVRLLKEEQLREQRRAAQHQPSAQLPSRPQPQPMAQQQAPHRVPVAPTVSSAAAPPAAAPTPVGKQTAHAAEGPAAAGAAGASNDAGSSNSAGDRHGAPNPKRSREVREVPDGRPVRPQRPPGHTAQPPRQPENDRGQAFSEEHTCNYALLVAAHRATLRSARHLLWRY